MNKSLILMAVLTLQCSSIFAVCTESAKVEYLAPRGGGWVHVKLQGIENMDIMSCGNATSSGLVLNFNDVTGTEKGKDMLHSTLLSALMLGRELKLCSTTCDSQHPTFSTLDRIDGFR